MNHNKNLTPAFIESVKAFADLPEANLQAVIFVKGNRAIGIYIGEDWIEEAVHDFNFGPNPSTPLGSVVFVNVKLNNEQKYRLIGMGVERIYEAGELTFVNGVDGSELHCFDGPIWK